MTKLPEIIKLIKENQINIVQNIINDDSFSPEDAEELFILLYNYTNSFKNYNTTPEILILAWNILERWISHDKIIVAKNKRSIEEMKMYAEIIKTLKIYKNWLFAGFIVTQELLNKYNLKARNINWFIFNLLSIIAWIKFWILLIENGENESLLYIIPKYKSEEAEKIRNLFWITYENKVVNKNYKEILETISK